MSPWKYLFTQARCIGAPFSVAMPIVALAVFAFCFASPLWARMPFAGKKKRLPRAESIEKRTGQSFASASLAAFARGFRGAGLISFAPGGFGAAAWGSAPGGD